MGRFNQEFHAKSPFRKTDPPGEVVAEEVKSHNEKPIGQTVAGASINDLKKWRDSPQAMATMSDREKKVMHVYGFLSCL